MLHRTPVTLKDCHSGRVFGPIRPQRRVLSVVAMSAVAKPAQLPLKTLAGAEIGSETLALKVATDTAKGLVHRYLVYVQQNARAGTASTLTRSEVRGGGRKPYAQKGSGNARRGSLTSPLFPGGGKSFGPKPKDWSIKMNKKERRLALATALQSAANDIIVVDDFKNTFTEKKTKAFVSALDKLGVTQDEKVLLIVDERYENLLLASRNVPTVALNSKDNIKVFDVLNADKIIVEKAALVHLNSFYGPSEEKELA